MRTTRILAAVTVALALGVTSCGNADQASQPDAGGTARHIEPSPESSDKGAGEPTPADSAPVLDYVETDDVSTFSVKKPDGTAYDVTVETGTLRRAQAGLAVGPRMSYDRAMHSIGEVDILGQGCSDVDLGAASQDAVIPIQIKMTDTTQDGWKTEPDIQLTAYAGDEILDARHDVVIEQSAHLDEGYACEDAGRAGADANLVGVRMDTSRSDTPGWLILDDFYRDATRFEDVRLVFGTRDQALSAGRNVFSDATGDFSVPKARDTVVMDLKSTW